MSQFTDQTPMPWGKHKGTPMANVPKSYLLWLHGEGVSDQRVSEYIKANLDAIMAEKTTAKHSTAPKKRKRSGNLVQTSSGSKGMIYHDEKPIVVDGVKKMRVYLVGQDFSNTGEKLLCEMSSLQVIGFFD